MTFIWIIVVIWLISAVLSHGTAIEISLRHLLSNAVQWVIFEIAWIWGFIEHVKPALVKVGLMRRSIPEGGANSVETNIILLFFAGIIASPFIFLAKARWRANREWAALNKTELEDRK
jgi:hypothetical protein